MCIRDRFNVEATGPTAVISFPSNGLVVGPSGEIIFSAEGATSVTCTLDGSAVACTTPTYAYTLPGGEHTFTVQAFDGGVGGAPATVTFTVDASPPVVQQIVL